MSGSMSISGIVSGVDWDSMIDSIIEAAQQPAMVKVNKRTNLVNKKSLFEEMKVSMQSLQSSISPLKLPSTYKAKEIEIERLDRNGSSKGVLTASVNADAEVAVYDLKVEQLATAQTVRSNQITSSKLSSLTNMPESSTLYITAAGQKVGIEVSSSDSLQSLKSKINNKLKTLSTPIDVTASVVDNRLILKSDNTGEGATTVNESFTINTTGRNTLSDIFVQYPEDLELKNSSGTTYTLNQDFQVVNNNEIRWIDSTIDDGSVKTGDAYTATYTTSGTDNFRSKAITRGSSTTDNFATALGFTISSISSQERYTITSVNGEILTDNSIESDSSVRIKYENGNKRHYGEYFLTFNQMKSQLGIDTDTMDEDEINEIYNKAFVLTDSSKTYVYGTDFTLSEDTDTGWIKINWAEGAEPAQKSDLSLTYYTTADYQENTYVGGTDFTLNGTTATWTTSTPPAAGTKLYLNYTTGDAFDSTGTETQTLLKLKYGGGEQDGGYLSLAQIKTQIGVTDDTDETLQAALFNRSLTITDSNNSNYEYKYGTDYTLVDNGNGWAEIQWLSDGQSPSDISNLTVSYNTNPTPISTDSYGTATDQNLIRLAYSEGELSYNETSYLSYDQILRYLRINDSTSDDVKKSLFNTCLTITNSNGITYTYGDDFTISEGTGGWASLDWGENVTEPENVTISLNTPSRIDVKGDEVITTSTGYRVLKSADYTNFNFNLTDYISYLGFAELVGCDPSSVTSRTGLQNLQNVEEHFQLSNTDGTSYTYGTDYYIRARGGIGTAAFAHIQWLGNYLNTPPDDSDLIFELKDVPSTQINITGGTADKQTQLKIYDNSGSLSDGTGSYFTLSELNSTLGITSTMNDSAKAFLYNQAISIKDSNDTEYLYGTYYTLESDDNDNTFIVWDPSVTAPKASDLTIKFGYSEQQIIIDGDDSKISEYNVVLFENANGTTMTYEQLLAKLGLDENATSNEINSAFDEYFTVTDSSGNTYTRGTDFNLVTDNVTGFPEISWGTTPQPNDVTFSFNKESEGGDVITFNLSRNDTDLIQTNTSKSDVPTYTKFQNADTITITYGDRTYYEGYDFEIAQDDDANATIKWNTTDSNGNDITWYQPDPGQSSIYTINLYDEDGNLTHNYSAFRSYQDSIDMTDIGFTSANGAFTSLTFDGTTYEFDDDNAISDLSVNFTKASDLDTHDTMMYLNWAAPSRTANSNLPSYGDTINAEYAYNVNTFALDSDNDNLLSVLGLNYNENDLPDPDDYTNGEDDDDYKKALAKYEEHFTAAQDAVFYLDGERETRSSNYIGEDYNNELIKGMTIHLTGVGEVSLEVSHDAEKAVESIQTMVDSYNSIMSWINTRMSEKQLDETTAATVDSDDFRMRWGLLHGNSLLRQTKSKMRDLISQNFVFTFTERSSSDSVYGTMGFNGLKSSSTLRIRYADGKYADLTVNTDDTLETLLKKLDSENNSKITDPFYDIYYDEDGKLRQEPLVKFAIDDDKLSIKSTTSDEITLSGTSAMNALKLNYTYKGLYQIGIQTTSDDYGKSGEIDFDSSEFMEALEDNPDEVQALMLKFAGQMDTWVKSMLTSSGDTSGTLTREIENLENQISDIDEYLSDYQDRLDRQEESLRSKYNSAEQQISSLSQQANSIAAILNQLNGYTSSSSSDS